MNITEYDQSVIIDSKQTPSPGQYDNFKLMFDRSKQRVCTMHAKFKPTKSAYMPGPANYETRSNKFSTMGGAGSSTG